MIHSIVKLDGIEQYGVVSYDVAKGQVKAAVIDSTGLPDPEIALACRRGVVTVEPRLRDASVPLRLSVDDDDFDPYEGALLVIHLNGVEQRFVLSFDIEAGTLTRIKLSESGRFYACGDAIATETLHGVVTVSRRLG